MNIYLLIWTEVDFRVYRHYRGGNRSGWKWKARFRRDVFNSAFPIVRTTTLLHPINLIATSIALKSFISCIKYLKLFLISSSSSCFNHLIKFFDHRCIRIRPSHCFIESDDCAFIKSRFFSSNSSLFFIFLTVVSALQCLTK